MKSITYKKASNALKPIVVDVETEGKFVLKDSDEILEKVFLGENQISMKR